MTDFPLTDPAGPGDVARHALAAARTRLPQISLPQISLPQISLPQMRRAAA